MHVSRFQNPLSAVYICLIVWTGCLFGAFLYAPAALAEEPSDLEALSLEELMQVKVTSVSRKAEQVSEVPAAVYVITREDIRRSGVTSIPEALRLAPGVQVARVSAMEWKINIRGLNEVYANKLLVLIDGRSVYSPLFSGVFWDLQETLIEDIDRIEVIRGPGAAVWGANAVNGIINIITRPADQTQGGQVNVLAGSEEGSMSVRYGGKRDETLAYRVYFKGVGREDLADTPESDADYFWGNWHMGLGGFRMEWTPQPKDTVSVQSQVYANAYHLTYDDISLSPPYYTSAERTFDSSGGHVLGRWSHDLNRWGDMDLQVYYDHQRKDYTPGNGDIDTLDLDFTHRSAWGQHQEVVWGLGYRRTSDCFEFTSDAGKIDPNTFNQDLFSAFVQDEIKVLPDKLSLTLGTKLEHNDFTGIEIQPSLRVMSRPFPNHAVWAAVSRAVRVPSRLENHVEEIWLVVPPEPDSDEPGVIVLSLGNEDLESEELIAYEAGYRTRPTSNTWLDVAVFFHNYADLIGVEIEEDYDVHGSGFWEEVPLVYVNRVKGETYGLEVSSEWQPRADWRLKAVYSYLKTNIEETEIEVHGETYAFEAPLPPRNQFSIRSYLDLTPRLQWDLWLRYVDTLAGGSADHYLTLDTRLGWKLPQNWEISVVGQNLLDSHHAEYGEMEIRRSAYIKLAWNF